MKKILLIATLLSVTLIAQDGNNTKLTSHEKVIVKQNIKKMIKMDRVDKEIRVIDASIEKKKLSIYKTFAEIEKIVNGYECEKFKSAVNEFGMDLKYHENLSKEELVEKRVILKKLKSKLKSKCKGK